TWAHGVLQDAGRNHEHHGAERERGVGQEHLLDVEPGAHHEQGVDPPDERHRQVEQSRDGEIGADDPLTHAATTAVSRHDLSAVAVRITAPPMAASGPGVSPCASHAHTGLSTGSTSKNSEASSAGTRVMARDRNT